MVTFPPRILLAKIGLDGHDRGVKVLARSFRDAGMEVIYTGLWQTSEATMYAAMQEDVDVVGVSLLSAAHLTVMREMVKIRQDLGLDHLPLVLGGIIPDADYPALQEMGVAAIFNPGSPIDRCVDELRTLASGHPGTPWAALRAGYERRDDRCLAKLITAICREQELDGSCEVRQQVKCALDAYLIPVVDIIEEATGRSFDRSALARPEGGINVQFVSNQSARKEDQS